MSTAYLFPSTLQGLADVSVSPGIGQNGYPLVWNNSLGKWVISLLPYSSLSGTPTLGTMAAQNASNVSITGGSALNLSSVSQVGNSSSTPYRIFTHSSSSGIHSSQFLGYRSRGSSAALQGNESGDWLFFLGGVPRGNTGWSDFGTGFLVIANQSAASANPINNLACRMEIVGVNASNAFGAWLTLNGTTVSIPTGTASTSTTTGALTVSGGVGIGGALYVGGQINGLGAVQPGTPASATAAGTTGQVRWDANYIYVCVATNTWKRAPISAW
jgi:hypothetical protein